MSTYDPKRSQVSDDALATFLSADVVSDLRVVPGVGPKAAEMLENACVDTTHALLGTFLTCKKRNMDVTAHCGAFWDWLTTAGITRHRATIVHCVAEKIDLFMPGIYDASDVDASMR